MSLKKFWGRIMKKSRKEKGKKNMLSKVMLEKNCIKIPKKKNRNRNKFQTSQRGGP